MKAWGPRPCLSMDFYKAHGLGNDYLVFEEGEGWEATPTAVERVCHRTEGIGADGIVVLLRGEGRPSLRMFNPDGGEFERSGNGLRILASYLAREGRVANEAFDVEVGGDVVGMTVHGAVRGEYDVSVDMGVARVGPEAVGLDPAVLEDRHLTGPQGEDLLVVPVSVGNPHLVVLSPPLSEERLASVGPYLATHRSLSNGANVQIAEAVAPDRVRALIWERGVGRTSASGTSSCAVAVASVVEGWVSPGTVVVEMPGGELTVTVSPELDVRLRGPVQEVVTGTLLHE